MFTIFIQYFIMIKVFTIFNLFIYIAGAKPGEEFTAFLARIVRESGAGGGGEADSHRAPPPRPPPVPAARPGGAAPATAGRHQGGQRAGRGSTWGAVAERAEARRFDIRELL